MSGLRLRPEQQRVVGTWRSGYAALAAVPGAGKTTTLSALAARLIPDRAGVRRQVMIVTYQNSGVANFQRAIGERLREQGRPETGFSVRTLHGLASDVLQSVRHRSRLDVEAGVIDDVDADHLLTSMVDAQIERWREHLGGLIIDPDDPRARGWPDPAVLREVARRTIDLAKQQRADPAELRRRLAGQERWLPFALSVQEAYQDHLRANAWQDFNDLIADAVEALERDPRLCARLRLRWPWLLEDEAQDSTPLQERMLLLIAGPNGNLLRAGDPNQAIMTSFTSSDVRGFREWLARSDVVQYRLAGSSRSALPILALANGFVERVRAEWPVDAVRSTALSPQRIEPLVIDGVCHNPPHAGRLGITIREFERVEHEREEVTRRALEWLDAHPGQTVAILTGSRDAGYQYVNQALHDGLHDSRITRLLGAKDGRHAGLIDRLLPLIEFLQFPAGGQKLGLALERWSSDPENDLVSSRVKRLRAGTSPSLEEVLYHDGRMPTAHLLGIDRPPTPAERESLVRLERAASWLAQRLIPPHDLLVLIAATIGIDEEQRAIFNRLIVTIRDADPDPAGDRLAGLHRQLVELRDRHRRLRGSSEDDAIRITPGTLTVSTLHQAKGLEWDVVFVTGCDDFWFPGSVDLWRPHLRDFLGPCDPIVEARAELNAALFGHTAQGISLASAMADDACEVIAERLRLLYVAITRARRALWISWHRAGWREQRESAALPLLRTVLAGIQSGEAEASGPAVKIAVPSLGAGG